MPKTHLISSQNGFSAFGDVRPNLLNIVVRKTAHLFQITFWTSIFALDHLQRSQHIHCPIPSISRASAGFRTE